MNVLNQLLKLIEENQIADLFIQIDTLEREGKIELKNKRFFSQIRDEYVHGNVGVDFYDRLKVWISNNVQIILANTNAQNESINVDIGTIKKHIIQGDLEEAFEELLELTANTKLENDAMLLTVQFNNFKRDKNLSLINKDEQRTINANLTNSLLDVLKKL